MMMLARKFILSAALLLGLMGHASAATIQVRAIVTCAPGLAPFAWPGAEDSHCFAAALLLDNADIVALQPAQHSPWPFALTVTYGEAARTRFAAFKGAGGSQLAIFVDGKIVSAPLVSANSAPNQLDITFESDEVMDDVLAGFHGSHP